MMGVGIHYCTWARTSDSVDTALLRESTKRLGIDVNVLECHGFLNKPASLRSYLATLPECDIVLCTDGYDVLYVGRERIIRSRFESFDRPILFSGEKECFHHLPRSRAFFEAGAPGRPYPYLNSGLMIGYVGAIRSMLESISAQEQVLRREFRDAEGTVGFFNDQTIYGWYASLNPAKVVVDSGAEIFWTLSREKYDITRYADVTRDRVKNLEAHSEPCIVHVSHLKKFYPVYLYFAWKLGIPLSNKNVNTELLKSHSVHLLDNRGECYLKLDTEFKGVLEAIGDGISSSPGHDRSVAMIFIGTGRYIDFFERFVDSCRALFLKNIPKTFFVFTDAIRHRSLEKKDIVAIETPHQRWPLSTLLRFRHINGVASRLASYSHTVYIDADMYFFSEITEEEFFSHGKPLFGVRHPGMFHGRNAPFEFDPVSRACVQPDDDLSIYWQGCFWGGETQQVLNLSRTLSEAVDEDMSLGVIARWHDESHLNKYFIVNRHLVHTFDPGYAYPESMEGRLGFEKRIVHVKKNHRKMRAYAERQHPGPGHPAAGPDQARPGITAESFPSRRPGFSAVSSSSAVLLRDRNGSDVLRLNETGALIWRMCNGDVSADGIINLLCETYSVSAADIASDVLQILDVLLSQGLIEVHGSGIPPGPS